MCLGVACILVIAGCFYSITREPWIEWDQHDPRLHGQEVMFTEPMVYFSIDPFVWYGIDDAPALDLLFTRQDAMNDYRGTFSLNAKDVKPTTLFTITKSFWSRKNWWESAFASHIRYVVLENEDGKEVVSSFHRFDSSNRPELYEFKEKGYIK